MLNLADAPTLDATSSVKRTIARSIATALLLLTQLITSLLLSVALGQRLFLLAQARNGRPVAAAQFGPSDFVIVNGSRLAIPLTVATAIAFLLWLYRVCENLEVYRGKTLGFTPGEAVGSFFIPFVNLIRPYEVLRDVWAASSSVTPAPSDSGEPHVSGRWLVLVWWILFLARGIPAWWASLVAGGGGSEFEKVTLGSYGLLASHLLTMPAALAAIALVYLLDRRHDALAEAQQQFSPEGVGISSERDAV
jgi:hypothetical protein